jgi:hypothetical protein
MSGSECSKLKAGHFPDQRLCVKSKRLFEFIVEGEKRYWLRPPSVAAAIYGEAGIAIDRFDGSIVGQELEEVTE